MPNPRSVLRALSVAAVALLAACGKFSKGDKALWVLPDGSTRPVIIEKVHGETATVQFGAYLSSFGKGTVVPLEQLRTME